MSSGRGRAKAALPAAQFSRPASIDPSGLVLTVFGEGGGIERIVDFTGAPGSPTLRRALLQALDALSGPGRRWRSGLSVRGASLAARSFLAFTAALDDAPHVADHLTAAMVTGWRDSLRPAAKQASHFGLMRHVLLATEGLAPSTARALGVRVRRPPNRGEPRSYSIEEFARIRATAKPVFAAGLARIRANRTHLSRWYTGEFAAGSPDFVLGELLDSVLRTGDVPRRGRGGKSKGVGEAHHRVLGGAGPQHTWGRLFLTGEELYALAVLLVAAEGWNRSVLEAMTVPTHHPAAADEIQIHLVQIDKRRRPPRLRHTSNNLVDDGPGSAGRLMGQAIEATELARLSLGLLGAPSDRLLICRGYRADTAHCGFLLGAPKEGARRLSRRTALTGDDGKIRPVQLQPLRRTVQVRLHRSPAQNSRDTHDSLYVLRDASTSAHAADTVARGLGDALTHARTVTAMRMLLGDDAQVLFELADHPDLARAVLAGRADTATGACTDFTGGPHAPAGQPCPASFLSCLACRNAVATRRHLPRLVYLHRCLESLRGAVSQAVWELDWREHHQRLSALLNAHTTAVEREAHLQAVSAHDKSLIDRLLRRKLDA